VATTRSRSAAKVVGSIAVVGAAAAAAGLGTFGTFTDSTTPVDAGVDTGVVSIVLTPAAAQATVPYVSGGLLPGDHTSLPMDLRNAGNVGLSSLTLTATATASSPLDTDRVHGLQLDLRSCATSWNVVGSGYACATDATDLYAGPILLNQALPGARSLSAGAVDHLLATVSLPDTAGNALQNVSSSLSFTFTAAQRTGTPR
jgi:hypothetical protein